MKNLSDGTKDGIVLVYCKDGVLYPMGLRENEAIMLDLTIGMAIKKVAVIYDKPIGKALNLYPNKDKGGADNDKRNNH